jgi:hypothetical protein
MCDDRDPAPALIELDARTRDRNSGLCSIDSLNERAWSTKMRMRMASTMPTTIAVTMRSNVISTPRAIALSCGFVSQKGFDCKLDKNEASDLLMLDDPIRTLVKHLLVGTPDRSKEDSLVESEAMLTTIVRLQPGLDSIVEIGSTDASTIAAVHTTLDHAPGYRLFHPGGANREVAERNMRTFASKRALHSAISERSYPAMLRGPAGTRAYRTLAERVERYHGQDPTVVRMPDRRALPQPSGSSSGLVVRSTGSGRALQPNGSIDQLIDAARHRGYSVLALSLHPDAALHVRNPDLSIPITPERVVLGYSLAKTVRIENDVYGQLLARITGATSNGP